MLGPQQSGRQCATSNLARQRRLRRSIVVGLNFKRPRRAALSGNCHSPCFAVWLVLVVVVARSLSSARLVPTTTKRVWPESTRSSLAQTWRRLRGRHFNQEAQVEAQFRCRLACAMPIASSSSSRLAPAKWKRNRRHRRDYNNERRTTPASVLIEKRDASIEPMRQVSDWGPSPPEQLARSSSLSHH